ncbi:MAG: hypothetical protein KJO21_05695 [Verrucomicrobiae bacterium]|nr:hypothetical protein [Verrucomicrobiae bacterium]NNJ43215.1 hypothetical protein [Akkermansiaceae bacterium]
MPKHPEAESCADPSPLSVDLGCLCVASPVDFAEACFSVPAVRALASFRPQSAIHVLCPESQQAIWQSVEALDRVIVYPDKASARQIASMLKLEDVAGECAISWESGEAAKALARVGVVQRLGYPAAGLQKYLTDTVEVVRKPEPIVHRVRHYLNFVKKLGGDVLVKSHFQTPPLLAAPEVMRIALSPDSEYGLSYRWPLERMKQVVETINTRYDEVEWVILGMGGHGKPKRDDACAELETMLGADVKNHAQDWGREKIMHALRSCSALLACDGELPHLAAHVGLPAAVIFGPNEPAWKRPLGKQSRVVREHVACSPCYLSPCPIDHRCQNDVTVVSVVAALEDALSDRHAGS